MMNLCPDIFSESFEMNAEVEAHLRSCPSCALLVELEADGDQVFGEDCEEVELLLAVAMDGALGEDDRHTLERHMATCARCARLVAQTLLPVTRSGDRGQDLARPSWKHAAEVDELGARRKHSNPSRRLVAGALVLVAAAAVLALVVASARDEPIAVRATPEAPRVEHVPSPVTAPSENSEHAEPIEARENEKSEEHELVVDSMSDRVPALDKEATTLPGASRPRAVPVQPAQTPPRSVEALLQSGRAAIEDKQFAAGLRMCEEALVLDPGNQDASMMCAIAACNLQDAPRAQKHSAAIKGENRKAGLRQVCLRKGVDLATPVAVEPGACQGQERPSRKDITDGISKVRDRVSACRDRLPEGEERIVKVRIKIGTSGSVEEGQTYQEGPVERCVLEVVKTATFPQTCEGLTVTYPFVFRSK